MVGSYYSSAGEDSCVEVIIGGSWRAGCTGRRVREVGEAELFGHRVGDIDVGRLARLQVIVYSLDNGEEDAVVSRQGDRLIRRPRIWKCLRNDLDSLAARVGGS